MTIEIMQEFAKAWGQRDMKKVITFFSEDCIYKASVGPEPGTTFNGKEEIFNGILEMMKYDDGSYATIYNERIFDDFGFWKWTYKFKDGTEVKGCDFFEFEGNKIKCKNAFRKMKG